MSGADDVRDAVVAAHLAALTGAELDRDAFNAAVAALKADAQARKAELAALAVAYAPGRPPAATRAAALDAIADAFLERVRARNKQALIKKTRPW